MIDYERKKELETLEEKQKFYNSDDYSELLLKHVIRDADVFEAVKLSKVISTDFILSDIAGVKTYKQIADIVFDINRSPITRDILELCIKSKGDKKLQADEEDICNYLDYVYKGGLDAKTIIEQVPEFTKFRRYHKILAKKLNDPDELRMELDKVHDDVQHVNAKTNTVTLSPFEDYVPQRIVETINLGIRQIDDLQGGIAKGELGLIIGHSSSGKTAFASWIARQAAIDTYNVLYISAEEPATGIVARWYAQQFGLSYTAMYRGKDETGKRAAFDAMSEDDKVKLGRLRVVDARGMVPLTADSIKALIEQKAKEGFIAEVVFVDQMDYMQPIRPLPKGSHRWVEQQQIAFDCDLLSQHKILGEHEFALWIIHQGAGERKWLFGFNDIAGAKGIVRPFDTALGVGREPKEEGEEEKEDDHVNIFSMKIRHSQAFQITLLGEFKYMRFTEARPGFKPKAVIAREERKAMQKHLGRPKGSKNKPKGDGRANPIPEETPKTEDEN